MLVYLLSRGCLELTTGTTSGIFTVTHYHFQSLMWMLLKTRSVPLVVIKIFKMYLRFIGMILFQTEKRLDTQFK